MRSWLLSSMVLALSLAVVTGSEAESQSSLIVNNHVKLYADATLSDRPLLRMYTGQRVDVIDKSEDGEVVKVKTSYVLNGERVYFEGWVESENVVPIGKQYHGRSPQTLEARDVKTDAALPREEVRLVFGKDLPKYHVFQLRGDCHRNAYIIVDVEAEQIPQMQLPEEALVRVESVDLYANDGPFTGMTRIRMPIQTKDPIALDWREEGGTLVLILGRKDRLGLHREFPRQTELRDCY